MLLVSLWAQREAKDFADKVANEFKKRWDKIVKNDKTEHNN